MTLNRIPGQPQMLAARKIVEETLEGEVAEAVKRDHHENGYCESFNGKLRGECLNGDLFYSPAPEAHHPVIFTNAIPQSLAVM